MLLRGVLSAPVGFRHLCDLRQLMTEQDIPNLLQERHALTLKGMAVVQQYSPMFAGPV